MRFNYRMHVYQIFVQLNTVAKCDKQKPMITFKIQWELLLQIGKKEQ